MGARPLDCCDGRVSAVSPSRRRTLTTDQGASLYNRYRPTRFDEMVGQDHVAQAVGNALRAGRPARGYLFSGPRGTGKTTTARILARGLNCQSSDAPTPNPCGTCDSCRRIGHDDWLDVVEVDAASSARRIDEMRDWLETVRYAPVASRFRVTIMDEAHQIQDGASSALLKTLEEPPPHLIVILCTTHPWDLLPTIRSRVQHFVLRKPGISGLTKVLQRVADAEGISVADNALDALARAADGSYRDALGLLDQIAAYGDGEITIEQVRELSGSVPRDMLFELSDLVAARDAASAFSVLEQVLDNGADPEQLLRDVVTHMRYACLLQQGAAPQDEWAYGPEELVRLEAQANSLAPSLTVRALDLTSDAQLRIRHGGADPRLQLELIIAKLARPELDVGPGTAGPRSDAPNVPSSRPSVPPSSTAPAPAPSTSDASGPSQHVPTAEPESIPPEPSQGGATSAQEPTPAPVAPREPVEMDLEHITRVWPQVVTAVGESHPHLMSFLEDGTVSAVDQDTVHVTVSAVGQKMLTVPDHRRQVQQTLSTVLGRSARIEITAGATAPPVPTKAEQPLDLDTLRQELIATFDATPEEPAT